MNPNPFPELFNLFLIISPYLTIIAFLAPIIGGGELGVITIAFLFSNSLINFSKIVFFSFLGMITIDSIWFFIARSKFFSKFREWKKISKHYKSLEKNIERISHGKDILIISLAKIMVGTRILLIIYLSGRKISFKRFFFYNSLPTFIWAICLAGIGVLAAKGFDSIISTFESIQLAITFLVFFLFLLYIIQKWINQILIKRQGQ